MAEWKGVETNTHVVSRGYSHVVDRRSHSDGVIGLICIVVCLDFCFGCRVCTLTRELLMLP